MRATTLKHDFINHLGTSKLGRVVLHAACMIQHPSKASWHWRGVLRETK